MNSTKKKIATYLYLLITVGILVFIGLTNKDFKDAWGTLLTLRKRWICVTFLSLIVFILLEGYILHYFFKKQGVKSNFFSTLKTSVIGLYYSCITPSSSGGQPIQVLYFKKQGISVGTATSALSIKLICYQVTTVFASFLSFILCFDYVNKNLHKTIPFIILGLVVNLIPVVLIALLAVNKAILVKLFGGLIKILHKIHIVKNDEKLIEKGNGVIDEYCTQLLFLKENPRIVLPILAMTAMQVFALMVIVYFVYASFGLGKHSFFLVLCLQFMLYTSVSFTPLPGASGAQEVGFFVFFKTIFPGAKLYMALLIWRFFTYYLTIILGAVVVIYDSCSDMIMRKKAER